MLGLTKWRYSYVVKTCYCSTILSTWPSIIQKLRKTSVHGVITEFLWPATFEHLQCMVAWGWVLIEASGSDATLYLEAWYDTYFIDLLHPTLHHIAITPFLKKRLCQAEWSKISVKQAFLEDGHDGPTWASVERTILSIGIGVFFAGVDPRMARSQDWPEGDLHRSSQVTSNGTKFLCNVMWQCKAEWRWHMQLSGGVLVLQVQAGASVHWCSLHGTLVLIPDENSLLWPGGHAVSKSSKIHLNGCSTQWKPCGARFVAMLGCPCHFALCPFVSFCIHLCYLATWILQCSCLLTTRTDTWSPEPGLHGAVSTHAFLETTVIRRLGFQ